MKVSEWLVLLMVPTLFCLGSSVFAQPERPSIPTRIANICRGFPRVAPAQNRVELEGIDWGVDNASDDNNRIYKAVLTGLLDKRKPDFSGFSSDEVLKSMQMAFYSPTYFDILSAKITELSGGKLQLVDADVANFPGKVRGPYRYLQLISNSLFYADLWVGVGPYIDPVQVFESRRGFFSPWFETPRRQPGEPRGFWNSWF